MSAETTPRLGLPYLAQGQAQKEVTHNEALEMLELLVQSSAVSVTNHPPDTPKPGDMYIVGDSSAGLWAGKEKHIAGYISGEWRFLAPKNGWQVYNQADAQVYTYVESTTAWTASGGSADTIAYIPSGDLSSTDVQGAIDELENKKVPSGAIPTGGTTGQFLQKAEGGQFATTWRTVIAENIGFDWTQDVDASNVQKALEYLGSHRVASLKYGSSLATAIDLGRYRNGGSVIGAVKITIPSTAFNSNIKIGIKGLNRINNAMSWNAEISGYFNGTAWTYADTVLSPNCPFQTVRLVKDDTNPCILLGITSTAWSQPMIWVDYAMVAGSSAWEFVNDLPITVINDETGYTVNLTVTPKVLATTGFCGCRAYRDGGGTQSIPATASTKAILNNVLFDTHNFYDYTNSRIVIPANVNYVELTGQVCWNQTYTAAGSYRQMTICRNGSSANSIAVQMVSASSGNTTCNVATGPIKVTAGDYYDLWVQHNDSAAKSLDTSYTFLSMNVLN